MEDVEVTFRAGRQSSRHTFPRGEKMIHVYQALAADSIARGKHIAYCATGGISTPFQLGHRQMNELNHYTRDGADPTTAREVRAAVRKGAKAARQVLDENTLNYRTSLTLDVVFCGHGTVVEAALQLE